MHAEWPYVVISCENGDGRGHSFLLLFFFFLHPKLFECMGKCVLSMAHKSELRCSYVYLYTVKHLDFRKSLVVHVLEWSLLRIFF